MIGDIFVVSLSASSSGSIASSVVCPETGDWRWSDVIPAPSRLSRVSGWRVCVLWFRRRSVQHATKDRRGCFVVQVTIDRSLVRILDDLRHNGRAVPITRSHSCWAFCIQGRESNSAIHAPGRSVPGDIRCWKVGTATVIIFVVAKLELATV